MVVEWHWKAVAPFRIHCPGGCFFCWVPRVVQEELFEYLDSVVSVSGAVEGEE